MPNAEARLPGHVVRRVSAIGSDLADDSRQCPIFLLLCPILGMSRSFTLFIFSYESYWIFRLFHYYCLHSFHSNQHISFRYLRSVILAVSLVRVFLLKSLALLWHYCSMRGRYKETNFLACSYVCACIGKSFSSSRFPTIQLPRFLPLNEFCVIQSNCFFPSILQLQFTALSLSSIASASRSTLLQ